MRNLLALRDMDFPDLDASILSSTVPQLRPEWTAMAERYLGHEMPVVGPGVRTGMPIRMDNPREVGADRLVNAVAAYERVGGPCVVVDFGTAITFDCVGAAGEYIGGIIAPGVEISMEALTSRAAAIPKIDLTPPRALIGKSTVEAIRSGVIYGFAAQVDGIVGRLREELGDEIEVIATGGLADAIVPFCENIDDIDQMRHADRAQADPRAQPGAIARALVNFFYAQPVGHAIEALHYAHGHALADPELEVSVALNAATPVELAGFCPWVDQAYAVGHSLFDPSPPDLGHIPPHWDRVLDDARRHQPDQLELFPGLRSYYEACDARFGAAPGARLHAALPPAPAAPAGAAGGRRPGRGARDRRDAGRVE